jgi:hypothetical protein
MCIVQDSDEDKAQELAQMRKIYSSARVAIAATSASACTEGFLHDRRALFPMFNLEAKLPNGDRGTVTIIPTEDIGVIEPLARRAWTFQECTLAPRILSYGTRRARFFCSQKQDAAGCADGGFAPKRYRHDSSFEHVSQGHRYEDENPMRPRSDFPHSWMEYCEYYSKRDLTLSGDKLIAISAVAEYLAEQKLDGAYYAGLWERNFVGQLGWRIEPGTTEARPKNYRVPSWSWASVNGQCYWAGDLIHDWRHKYTCHVEQISVTPALSEAPLAAVSSAFIRVTGICREAIWRKSTYQVLNIDDRRPAIIFTSKWESQTLVEDVLYPDATDDFERDKTHVELLKIRGPNRSSALRRNLGMVKQSAGLTMLVLVRREDGNYSRVGLLQARIGTDFKISGPMKKKTFTIV